MRYASRNTFVAVVLVAAVLLAAVAATAAGKKATVKGELVCLSCYISHSGEGAGHAACARTCATKGLPVGLKAGTKVHVLLEDHANAAAYKQAVKLAGSKVTITGNSVTKGGVPGLTVSSVKKS